MKKFKSLENYRRLDETEMIKNSEQFNVLLQNRRSIREFSSEEIPIEIIENCIKAAGSAPSGANKQPWHFVIIKSAEELDAQQLIKRLDLIDERLDNIDSIVTTLVERMMEKPLVMGISCPKCGQPIEISITSNIRMHGKG